MARIAVARILSIVFATALALPASAVTIVTDADGDLAQILDLPLAISGQPPAHWNVTYVYGTYEDVFGVGSAALPPGWPIQGFNALAVAINAIANALDAAGVGASRFTNGQVDGAGSATGLVPSFVGVAAGCDWCVTTRGVYFTNSSGGWSPDGSNTAVRTQLTTVAAGYVVGPEVTWAVFSPVPVPEPASAGLLAAVGAALTRGRLRRRSTGGR